MAPSSPREHDWYALLDLEPGADEVAVRAAHRRKARELHPDVNPDPDATRRMAEINRARDVLLDPVQRAAFERARTGVRPFGLRRTPPPRPDAAPGAGGRMRFTFSSETPAAREMPQRSPRRAEPARDWSYDSRNPNATDWYSFLALQPWCTADEVREACAKLAREVVDDRLPVPERERRQAKLRAAAGVLTDPEAKRAYDAGRPGWRPPPGVLPDYYRLLEVRPRASYEDIAAAITAAHLALGKMNSHTSRRRDAEIREAHWVLRDPDRRAAYDAARRGGGVTE